MAYSRNSEGVEYSENSIIQGNSEYFQKYTEFREFGVLQQFQSIQGT